MLNTAALSQIPQTGTGASKSDIATTLAVERTRIAYDRTMMASTRTATSLIAFGFTIYKFFQIELGSRAPSGLLMGPRGFGLTLVSIGLISLLLAAIENRRNLRALTGRKFPRSMATIQAALISVLGILALVVMLLKG